MKSKFLAFFTLTFISAVALSFAAVEVEAARAVAKVAVTAGRNSMSKATTP